MVNDALTAARGTFEKVVVIVAYGDKWVSIPNLRLRRGSGKVQVKRRLTVVFVTWIKAVGWMFTPPPEQVVKPR